MSTEQPQPNVPTATLKISPASVELFKNNAQAFSAEPAGLAVTWSITSGFGVIDKTTGVYQAPSKFTPASSVVVTAVTTDGKQFGTATIVLQNTPNRIRWIGFYAAMMALLLGVGLILSWNDLIERQKLPSLVVYPAAITLDPNKDESIQFTALRPGNLKSDVTWFASEGKIDPKGLFQWTAVAATASTAKPAAGAPPETRTITITAASPAGDAIATAVVNRNPGIHMEVQPQGIAALASEQVHFRTLVLGPTAAAGTPPAPTSSTTEWTVEPIGQINEDGTLTLPGRIDRNIPIRVTAVTTSGKSKIEAKAIVLATSNAAIDWKRLLFVIIMGALGSMIYFTSSFVNYVGNRTFRSSWDFFYYSRPFVGGALAVIFFFLVGAGMVDATSTTDLMKVGLIAALVGLFSDKAVKKLSDIMDVVLASTKDDRHDKIQDKPATPAAPAVAAVTANKPDSNNPDPGKPGPNKPGPGNPPAPPPPISNRESKLGDAGAEVIEAQNLLNRNGAILVCDGSFGNATDKAVKEFQTATGLTANGVINSPVWEKLRALQEPSPHIPTRAVTFLCHEEIGSRQAYDTQFAAPVWPGGESGVTIGVGYDLGQQTSFETDWAGLLTPQQIADLRPWVGVKGEKAREAPAQLKSVTIPWHAAWTAFTRQTLPKFVDQTRGAFPKAEQLSPLCLGVLVSLVYNRGASMTDSPTSPDNRKEMRGIRDAVAQGRIAEIPGLLRDMKRRFTLKGLQERRDREAALFEEGLKA